MKFKALICLVCLLYRICFGNSLRLLYANRKDIRIVRTSSKNANETTVVDGLEDAIAVDFCFAEGFVFWTDVSLEKIKRIRVTGDTRKVEDVISVGLKKPEGLAVDWIAKKLYWTDCRDSDWERNRIEVANLDGSNRKVLFWKNLGLPRAIAVDPLKGFMFWTDWGEQPKIERAEMDGSNRRIIIRQDIHWPNGLTIDYSAEKIYWTDAKLFYIAKANYDGSNRQRIFRTPMPSQCVLGHPFALTLYENKIYWTDWKTRGIHSTNKNSGTRCQMIWSNAYSPMDIHAFEPRRQLPRPGQNPCNSTSNGGCSHLCLLNTHGHSCACPTGVKLLSDGKTCEQSPVHFLLLARKEDLRRISLDTPDLTDVVVPVSGIRHAVAIDFDPVDKFLYWSDHEKLEIKRCRMNGQNVEVLVSSEVKHPDGVTVDWVGRNLYWTDTGTDRIEVSRLDGTSRKVLISENLDEPRAITLDPTNGFMFWTDWGKHPKIERAALDGSHRTILVNYSVAWPNGLTIDYLSRTIYWADAKLDKIEVMNLDGSNRRVALSDKLPHIFGFTVLDDRLYWTDWQKRAIESVNKRTRDDRQTIIDSLPDLMGLKAVNLNLTYGSNDCQHNNGNCSHLCLYRPSGVKCECPNGMELLADKKSCILPEAFLLFANPDDIRRISLDTNNGTIIPLVGVKEANALDFSVHDMQIYWTDVTLKSISRAFLNGSSIEHLIVVDLHFPDGLAVDWIAKNLYWTDSELQRIEVARLDGQHRKMLIWKDLWEPRELTLDPVSGHMYWANGGEDPKIERADLDGSNRRTVVSNVTRPTGLTIDFSLGLIFWVDAEKKVIECADLNGTNRRTVATKLPKPFALTQYKDFIYWADWKLSSIFRANKSNGMDRAQIKGNIDFIMDLLVFHSSRQEGSNLCALNNGGCSHLCLAKPGNRIECSCPTHYTLSPIDNKICTAPRLFMLYSTKKDIRRILFNLSDNLDVVLPVRGLSDVLAIDYDINSHLVFWIDGTTNTIRCAFQNGTDMKIIILDAGAVPYDLALDPYGQQLYWTDTASNSIKVYSLKNKTNLGVVFREENVYPRSIVLHPEEGLMYFTNDNPVKKGIVQATMGGAEMLMLFSAKSPGDLAIDKLGRKLYWTDTELKKIEYGDLAGTNRATLVEMNVLHPVGIVVFGDYVYWIDGESRNIMKIKKRGEHLGSAVQTAVDDLSDIIVVDARKSTVYHPCVKSRCSHICLAGSHGQTQCSCPVHSILKEDNSTCEAPKKCGPDEFACSSGACLKKTWLCDDREDCIDGSDEKNCTPCKDGEHRCSGGKCISVKKLCDNEADCDDASDEDEENCPLKCLKNQFECVDNHIMIKCIPLDWKCDNAQDCADNSDEMDCNLPKADGKKSRTALLIPITEGPATAVKKKIAQIILITGLLSIAIVILVGVFLQRFSGRCLRNQTYDDKNPEPGVTFTTQIQEEDQLQNVHDCIDNNQSLITSREREEVPLSGHRNEESPLLGTSGVESPVKKPLQIRPLPPIPHLESQRMEQNLEHNVTCLCRLQSESQNPNFQTRDTCSLDSKGSRGNVLEEQGIHLGTEKRTDLIAVLNETENQPSRGSLNERKAETRSLLNTLRIDVSPEEPRNVRELLPVPGFGAAHLRPSKPTKERKRSSKYNDRFPINSQEIKQDYEIDLKRLEVQDEVLGEGEFGIVYKGRYHCKDKKVIDVAVKQLKDTAGMAEKVALLREIKMLKLVGRHPNIINLVGACTKGENILLVTGLIPGGSLESLLTSKSAAGEYDMYENFKCALNDRELIKIALQIASGMQHLESKKCIHGDLAARNVFIDENKVAKLGDFGLARDISDRGIYNKTSKGKVPWRWLSLESLRFLIYTSQSDVWSFGILLWEIVTFCELPYPDITTPWDLKSFLSSGRRMPRPDHCTEELYALMQSCWMENPLMRPTFEDITKQIKYLLTKKTRTYVNVQHDDITYYSDTF